MMVEDGGHLVGALRFVALTGCVGLLVSCTHTTQAHKLAPSSALLTASTAVASSMSPLLATASASPAPVSAAKVTASPAANASPTTFAAGELAALARLSIKGLAPITGYSRAQFGPTWPELADCDARNRVLARDLTKTTLQGSCIVKTGTLLSPYSGATINFGPNPAAVQVDDVVALPDAWQTGAQTWTAGKREIFANDLLELLAVDAASAEQKGDADAATWLPSNKAFQCDYVETQIDVKTRFGLWVTQAEHDAIARVLASCVTPAPVATAVPQFLPPTYRVTSTTAVDLDGSDTPQVIVTAVGTVEDGGSSGLAPSTVLLLTFDPFANRWTRAFDASQEQSYQTSTQQGAGPGLVDPTRAGPQIALIHDQPAGGADLLYWVNSVGGNSGKLIVGIVHFASGIATLTYSEAGDEGHIGSFDVPTSTPAGVSVSGSSPQQMAQITLPWITAADSRSQAARMYTRTLAPIWSGSYQVVADDRPYVGVAVSPLTGGTEARVESVDPNSPASGVLKVGDILTAVADTGLGSNITSTLIGPPIIDEVAILQPEMTVTLQIVRNGTSSNVTLRLAHWSPAADALAKIGPTAL
jgi:hypothetical protein